MHFTKYTILFLVAVGLIMNTAAVKRKATKSKIKKVNIQQFVAPPCGCKKPALVDVLNCGCQLIEPALGALSPLDIAIPACQSPVIDIPNYRYAEPLELNPLGCLFPSIEIPNYGLLSAPMSVPNVEYFSVDLPCGCPKAKCGCRSPAVKLPAYPKEYVAIDVPGYGCQGMQIPSSQYYEPIAPIIELPSYAPVAIPSGCRSACGCRGPCSCPELQILPCGCQGSCSCPSIPIASCGCQGPCSCPEYQILPCGCQGSCSCPAIPISSCGCQGACSCPEYPFLSCGCQGVCSCPGIPMSCGCQGPCSCGLPVGLLPAVDLPCTCGCGVPGCNCGQYLRQVTLQPPFL